MYSCLTARVNGVSELWKNLKFKIMGRENCQMCHFLGSTMYCDYYDVFYAKCSSVGTCPDGLDDEDDMYDEEYYEDDIGEWK